jgi:hypothetical protein
VYTLTFSGIAGPEADITNVRLYIDGTGPTQVGASPSEPFEISATWPDSGSVLVEYSFVDAAGNESPRHAQIVDIPDSEAPAIPVENLTLLSIVWGPA